MESVISLNDNVPLNDGSLLPFEDPQTNQDASTIINSDNLNLENLNALIHALINVTLHHQQQTTIKSICVEPHDLRNTNLKRNIFIKYARISAKNLPGHDQLTKLNF